MRVLRHSWNVKEVFRYLAVGFCTPHGLSFNQLWREQDLILNCSTFYIILFLTWFKVGLKFLCLVLPLFASSGNLINTTCQYYFYLIIFGPLYVKRIFSRHFGFRFCWWDILGEIQCCVGHFCVQKFCQSFLRVPYCNFFPGSEPPSNYFQLALQVFGNLIINCLFFASYCKSVG